VKVYPSLLALAFGVVFALTGADAAERFVPCDELTVYTPDPPTHAEALALAHFNEQVRRFTGLALPQHWGGAVPRRGGVLLAGNWEAVLAKAGDAGFPSGDWTLPNVDDKDVLNQSYLLQAAAERAAILAAGCGTGATPRDSLGLGYALGDLVRRLEKRGDAWGFVLPADPVAETPAMPNRTLYLMNSTHMNPGLSLEFFDDAQLEAYADFLVDARYSRVCFFQWESFYLYPGNNEAQRARNQFIHRRMRQFFEFARSRGLEIYQQLSPVHVPLDLLPDDERLVATGYYGRMRLSTCWAQPEARAFVRDVTRAELEYFGPVDGYMVWFYDPGGCFCDVCYPDQAQYVFEQLMLVHDLAQTISPGAKFQASLWPTWAFVNEESIPFESEEEVHAFVEAFLEKVLAQFGPRAISIIDSVEADTTNVYNGYVNPEQFLRTGFLYTPMGAPSEAAYPFPPFRIPYIHEIMAKARDRGLEDSEFFIQYAATNYPSVFAFADVLYDGDATVASTLRSFASTIAKGEALDLSIALFEVLERAYQGPTYEAKAAALEEAATIAERLGSHALYFGDPAWLRGHVLGQQLYLSLARVTTEDEFMDGFVHLQEALGANPMYHDYATNYVNPGLVARQVRDYWRRPLNDRRVEGLPGVAE